LKRLQLVKGSDTLFLLQNGKETIHNGKLVTDTGYSRFEKLTYWDEYDCRFSINFIVCSMHTINYFLRPTKPYYFTFSNPLIRIVYKLGYSAPYLIEKLDENNTLNP
jgi:hypothetical protein